MEKNPENFDNQPQQAPYPPAYYPSLPPQDQSYVNQHQPMAAPQQPTVTVVQMPNLGSDSMRMTCPHCQAEISTRVRHQAGTMTHVAALILCLLVCWPCVCIPYCTDSCMDADHECPNCQKYIGHYKR